VLTSPVTTELRDYVYDPIGNRTNITVAANNGTYSANNLNQYSTENVAGGGTNTFTYDDDGNLTAISGNKNVQYVYNAENQAITMQPTTPVLNDKKVDLVYDYQGRRVQKTVSNWSGVAWAPLTTKRFVYDGWNVIEEQTVAGTSKYYVWGMDLSQSLQSAGGIGGLLTMFDGVGSYAYLYDGNGNVGQMVNNVGGAIAAHYEYDPYGNSIVATGSQAAGNPYRFSTKYLDSEYNLYYYGYRYYDPATGRWVNHDPIGERGGWNLYCFVFNNPQYYIDDTGRTPMTGTPTRVPLEILERIPTVSSKIPIIIPITFGIVIGDYIADRIEDIENGPIKYYLTYLFRDKCKIVRYVGRTGGDVNRADLFWKIQADIAADRIFKRRRDYHHIKLTDLDGEIKDAVRGDVPRAKDIIRGREQQLIDLYGGAQSDPRNRKDTPLINQIRGVAKDNKLGRDYHTLSNIYFREQLHEYTGF
jgi:RHS repeat-associated protein